MGKTFCASNQDRTLKRGKSSPGGQLGIFGIFNHSVAASLPLRLFRGKIDLDELLAPEATALKKKPVQGGDRARGS